MLLARQRRRRETLPPAGRVWGYLQDVTVGYGYRPGRAALWMAVLWAFGAVYFATHRMPAPVDSQAWPQWNPALLALDLLLPVVDLGQDGGLAADRRRAVGGHGDHPAGLGAGDDGRGGCLAAAAKGMKERVRDAFSA